MAPVSSRSRRSSSSPTRTWVAHAGVSGRPSTCRQEETAQRTLCCSAACSRPSEGSLGASFPSRGSGVGAGVVCWGALLSGLFSASLALVGFLLRATHRQAQKRERERRLQQAPTHVCAGGVSPRVSGTFPRRSSTKRRLICWQGHVEAAGISSMGEARNSAGRRATYADVESWAAVVVVGDGLAASRPHHSYPCTERARCLRRGQSLVVWAGGLFWNCQRGAAASLQPPGVSCRALRSMALDDEATGSVPNEAVPRVSGHQWASVTDRVRRSAETAQRPAPLAHSSGLLPSPDTAALHLN